MLYSFIIEQTELFQEVQYKFVKNQLPYAVLFHYRTVSMLYSFIIEYAICMQVVSWNQTVLQPKALLICALLDTHIIKN
jgi:hypothetical protein